MSVVWGADIPRGQVLYRDNSGTAYDLTKTFSQVMSTCAPFTSAGSCSTAHSQSDQSKAVFLYGTNSVYEVHGGCPVSIGSLGSDHPTWLALGAGSHLWTGTNLSNINRYSYPGLVFEASIGFAGSCYGLAADGSDNLYFWDYSGGNGRLHKQTLGGSDSIILTEADVGERRAIAFNGYDGHLYEHLDGVTKELRRIDTTTGTPTTLATVSGNAANQPTFTPDGGVWLGKRASAGHYHVHRWDIPGAALTFSDTPDQAGQVYVPIVFA